MSAANPTAPNVLIVEGDPWVRDMLSEMLLSVRCDARLQVCADGSQALSALSSKPDLIIAARELAGVDGLDLLRKVRAKGPGLPFILMSNRSDSASVREALPLHPTAYLSKPLNLDNLRKRLEELLVAVGEEIACPMPALQPGASLPAYLEQRRANADGGPLLADVQVAIKRALNPQGLNLKVLEEEVRNDPQVTAVLIAAANSAALHREAPVQTLLQALNKLGSTQSMNLILGMTLKRSARLSDPLLAEHAARYWDLSLHTAEYGRTLARLLELDEGRCYCAGLLHCLGDLAVLRCLQEWRLAGGELDERNVQQSLDEFGAAFGSALRTRWRLPLALRELIAAIYQLGGGVYSREILAMSLAGQLSRLPAEQGLEKVASGKTARLLKLGLPELNRLRKVENPEVKPQEEPPV
ncbi:TPA: HDOD domain-containing protein [Pseudomonas putida]|jgi:HD-like signal output (HDOD) protein/ActR/RegA family two-component response regulator|uniref:Signal transduction protein n=1 Tax=Pseudomonas putida (strain GB-1) TaxID=76869 RepID=B0KH33_PSEPG|nr:MULTISPECIES: response regulator [Pseudomonas]ABY96152.1 putative signal transduction protein [Pseudomonas putida GB-1]APE96791.1 histidine kinase [Pseudomonas putida]MBP0709467.1 response regulator [Pseudomonas sp. T34]MCE1001930.1 response regulator [Pseudomonas sp. NMI1173_11]MCK2188908.1 response regulator [Pseudomonas sp. MB04B]